MKKNSYAIFGLVLISAVSTLRAETAVQAVNKDIDKFTKDIHDKVSASTLDMATKTKELVTEVSAKGANCRSQFNKKIKPYIQAETAKMNNLHDDAASLRGKGVLTQLSGSNKLSQTTIGGLKSDATKLKQEVLDLREIAMNMLRDAKDMDDCPALIGVKTANNAFSYASNMRELNSYLSNLEYILSNYSSLIS